MVRERKIIPNEPDNDGDDGEGKNGSKSGGTDDGQGNPPNSPSHVPGSGIMAPGENDTVLRPKRIADMVGQQEVMDVIQIAMDAAKKRKEPLGHILFDGPPGLGKTTFATCIPLEMGVKVDMTSGPVLKAPKEMIPYLTNLEYGSVLFIDEIHRLPKPVEEFLYTAMEDYRIDIILGEGVNARTLNLQLQPFTLIGATTRAGMLSAPLRDRFVIRQHLGYYSVDELIEILSRNATKLNVTLNSDAAVEIDRKSVV